MNKILFSFLCVLNLLWSVDATIDLVKTIQKTPSIQVTYLDNKNANYAKNIYKVLLGDLKVSGHFLVREGEKSKANPDYTEFVQNKTDLFVNIEVLREESGIRAIVRLYDINMQNLVLNKAYTLDDEKLYPFVAHKIAIDVNEYIKAPSIDWMKRYIVLSANVDSGKNDILISDYTLTYRKTIINDGLNIFPKWANTEQTEIYYTKIIKNYPVIIKYNVYTGVSTEILKSKGMAIVSSVSKDGKKLLMTLSPNGDPDIYLYDVESGEKIQMTKYRGIDVSGNFIDNDTAMIFVSDRLGYPNVFTKKLEENAPIEQVVFHGKNNSSVTSHNNYVVYTSRETNNEFGPNVFNLYLISTQNDFIRRLTTNGINQLPKFSDDGDSVMFIKNSWNQSALGVIRLNYNKTYLFPLNKIQIQSFDW
ncbi:Tol-Pal system protein TolB [Helicobacter anatolicus]|uniref:Tol-Pal system protein TolB n=1 Tax=Helicobacter anatolicus TaxID=2905874 RepID=UPI001E5A134B|nr:Tol-Pal system protein TolB [Helicobacter anatolicus]MCE3039829.1 Tol-Pal system protein TolB [Helicobacter anatolicus]